MTDAEHPYRKLLTLCGVKSIEYGTQPAEGEFCELDSYNTSTIYYLDDRDPKFEVSKKPWRNHSPYLINFNKAAQEFGYKYKGFSREFYMGHWSFNHPDWRYPYINITPGSHRDDSYFRVTMEYELKESLKTYDECYNHIFSRLQHCFKNKKGNYIDIQRNLTLQGLLNTI